jgi:hypothetical protein
MFCETRGCIGIVFDCQCCNKIKEFGTVMQGDWVQDCDIVAASLNSFGIVHFPTKREKLWYFSLTDHVIMPNFPT